MNKHRGRSLIIVTLVALIATGTWLAGKRIFLNPIAEEVTPTQSASETATRFDFTAVQLAGINRRVISCRAQQCQPIQPQASEDTPAVTDGVSWYHYQDGALKRTWIESNESIRITERTPLAEPRSLLISPDGTKVAFWLDNIDQPAKKLTELWAYNSLEAGTKLLAEKIVQPAVLTTPRWNRSSTHLWFIGDNSETGDNSKLELVVVSVSPPNIAARFTNLNWSELQSIASQGAMDISPDGDRLAYATSRTRKTSTLNLVDEGGKPQVTTIRGTIPYIQWIEDGTLVYATQDSEGFTFWQIQGSLHRHIARSPGQLQSVRADVRGQYITFAKAQGKNKVNVAVLDIMAGTITEQQSLAPYGDRTYLVHAQEAISAEPAVAGISDTLADDQLVNFIEQHLPDIARAPAAKPERILVTDKPNTVYVDYRDTTSPDKRILITVRDVMHVEWSISGRFEERGGEWVKTQGGGLSDPKPLRLYEWENSLNRWILKEEY